MSEIDSETMFFNGIDGASGKYSLPPISPQQFSDAITRTVPESDPDQEALRYYYEQYCKAGNYGIKEGHDAKKLDESGWGVIFAHDADPAVVEALRPLLDWRKSQSGKYYKEYSGGMGGFRPADSKTSWLGRQGGSVGPADPELVPYYLMIVGSPERIPYRFQSLLDVQYAVGRIHFDTLDEYAQYAQSVVTAEKEQVRLPRRMTFFGAANADDPATKLSSENLVAPLLESLGKAPQDKAWEFQSFLRDGATKARLGQIMSGTDVPGLLFTASHGMGFPNGDRRQIPHQGALLCQDWPGPRKFQGPVPEDFYFSADDLGSDANLLGMIAFFFACYGAGTPLQDEFAQQAFKDKKMEIAPRPFIASLPKRMLSLPKGGALAVVGHVERAWGYSFFWGKNRSLAAFESSLLSLMNGYPIGYAMEVINERYAEISTELTDILNEVQFGLTVEPLELASKWTANNDSKNYIILGDPAVRMMVAEETSLKPAQRPTISVPAPSGGNEASFTAPDAGVIQVKAADVEKNPTPTALGNQVTSAEPVNFSITETTLPAAVQPGSPQEMLKKLATFIAQAIDSAATLDVRTYTSDQVDKVNLGATGKLEGANLRAMTVIKILGDIEQVVPVQEGEVNHELWDIHQETVKQAQASRNDLIQAVLSTAASLTNLRISR